MSEPTISDRLNNVMTWLREPDWTEEATAEWLMDWMDRRPIAELAMVAMLMPSEIPPATRATPCQHAAIIGLDGMWHCQKCGDAIDMAVAHSSQTQNTEAT